MNLIERAKNIILTPASEWEVINNETTTTAQLYTGYIMLLAAIGPLAMIIGGGFFGFWWRLPMAISSYVFSLIGVFIIALIIDFLAPNFGAQKNQAQALKLAAYAHTPLWIAGILHILPFLGLLVLLAGLYGLYLLYLGLPVLMKAAQEKLVAYTVVIVVCVFVVFAIFASVMTVISGIAIFGTGMVGSHASVNVDAMRQLGANIESANKNTTVIVPSTPQVAADPAAAMNAAAAAMQGNGTAVEPVDQALLKAMLPDSIGSMKRNRSEANRVAVANFKISKADAGYADDQGHSAELSISDLGGTAAFTMLAAWATIEQDSETDDGYEKMGKVDGRPTHQRYNKKSQDGEYTVVVGNRFLVESHGHQVDMDTLKQAVNGVGLDKLEALKNSGVKQ